MIGQRKAKFLNGPQALFLPGLGVTTLLLLMTLACTWGDIGISPNAQRLVIRKILPTLTPTVDVSNQGAVSPTVSLRVTPIVISGSTATPPTAVAAIPTALPAAPPIQPAVPAGEEELVLIPTETPVADPVILPTPVPIATDAVDAVLIPPIIVIPTTTPIPETSGWAFANIRTYSDQYEGGLLLYGEMINNTGTPQEVAYITGAFFDAQGHVIADQDRTSEYWPVDIIPAGGQTPFELAVNGIQTAADFHLWANSAAASQSPRQDFNFDNVEQWSEDENYCLTGQLQNPGGPLQDFLVVAAVLYDDQGKVVNFGETYESDVAGGESVDFEICIDPPHQNVARYDLKAWGK